MIGTNIKKLRAKKGMTQKQLADLLFVSAQAVSRWENNEVEPSLSTIAEMAKIFDVTTDEIIGLDEKRETPTDEQEDARTNTQKEEIPTQQPKQQLALCVKCNSPIYEKKDICRDADDRIFCRKCHERKKAQESSSKRQISAQRRANSFGWGIAAAVAALILCIWLNGYANIGAILYTVLFAVSMFTFVSCCILDNNFIGDMAVCIFSWGFVKMPGLIFTLDLDGCLWFITVKLTLALISFLIAIAFGILAVLLSGALSLIVYPFALYKNINFPEDI